MKAVETIYNIRDYKIFSAEYKIENCKANVVIVHGFRGYGGRLIKLAEYLVSQRYSAFLIDLPHHGRSSGEPKTYVNSIDTLVNVTNDYIDIIKQSTPDVPLFLIGHSMGGLVTCIISRQRTDLSGGIAMAPAIIIKTPIFYWLYYLFAIILFFFPQIFIPCPSNKRIFPNEEIYKIFHSDKYVFNGKLAVNTTFEMVKTGEIEKNTDITIPFYLEHGDIDMVVDVIGSRIKSKYLKNEKSRYIEYQGLNHVLFEENNAQEQFSHFAEWMNNVLSP